MAFDAGSYGGGLMGSFRGDHERTQPSVLDAMKKLDALRRGTRPASAPPATGGKTPTAKPKPKPKPKAKAKNPFDKFEAALKTPKLDVPTLVTPNLDPIPTLQTAALEDYDVAPITLGPVPTIEDIPDQQPTVEIDDRQSARMRRAKLTEIANMKARRGIGSTLLSGAPSPSRATGVPANQMARAQLGDNRAVMTRKGV